MSKKALIAMSGGVDSSVAAKLVTDMGIECIGCTMKLYNNEDIGKAGRTCCSLDDTEDARSVAKRLGMPYYVFNFTDDFREKVIDRFIFSYEHGMTPNPCIDCNRYMKFDKLYERARIFGCDYIVTGHYARIEKSGDKYLLKKALDASKDQSYVLYNLTQEQLAHTLFPLGEMNKTETRKIADESGFINADKPDSQDICFVPDGNYAEVIEKYTGKKYPVGLFKDQNGNTVGTHKGIIHYTIGQRKGLGLTMPYPTYVTSVSPVDNTVTVGEEKDLYKSVCKVTDFHMISGEVPKEPFRCSVKARYRQTERAATVIPIDEKTVEIRFDEPQRAITPGQSAVLYDGDTVLGGGIISF
ncbi:MAG: tRNA 2-thiouridine(34) synthase MnmA [Eubacteriales bacterium]